MSYSKPLAAGLFREIVSDVNHSYSSQKQNRFNILQHIGVVLKSYPDVDFTKALSQGQIQSKKWLIEKLELLNLELGTVFVLGGWWGILPAMMFESELRFEKIRSFDLDATCAPIADKFNLSYLVDGWKFKASTHDMLELNYLRADYTARRADGSVAELCDIPNTIINTSCEHLESFKNWWDKIPTGKLLVLQSNNNFQVPEHKSSVNSLEEFEGIAPLKETHFRGTLSLPDYDRYMLIGRK